MKFALDAWSTVGQNTLNEPDAPSPFMLPSARRIKTVICTRLIVQGRFGMIKPCRGAAFLGLRGPSMTRRFLVLLVVGFWSATTRSSAAQ